MSAATDRLVETVRYSISTLAANLRNACGSNSQITEELAGLAALDELVREHDRQGERLERTLYIAEHLWQMIPQSAWRDTGGDDMQGHYEGDYHAEQVRDELAEIRSALSPPPVASGGERE